MPNNLASITSLRENTLKLLMFCECYNPKIHSRTQEGDFVNYTHQKTGKVDSFNIHPGATAEEYHEAHHPLDKHLINPFFSKELKIFSCQFLDSSSKNHECLIEIMQEPFLRRFYDYKTKIFTAKKLVFIAHYIEFRESIVNFLKQTNQELATKVSVYFKEKNNKKISNDQALNLKVKELLNLDLKDYFKNNPRKNTIIIERKE